MKIEKKKKHCRVTNYVVKIKGYTHKRRCALATSIPFPFSLSTPFLQ